MIIIPAVETTMKAYKAHQTHLGPAEEEVLEQEDIKKLVKVVEGSLESIAKMTKLSLQEVMHIIEEVDVAQLTQATQKAIKNISNATDLDRADITSILKADSSANVDNIVHRLREESRVHRARW
jgi:DNA replication protein DnaD